MNDSETSQLEQVNNKPLIALTADVHISSL